MHRSNARKTANILQEVGRALYGDIWQSELARDLGCNDRTVRKWNAGDAPIPEYLRGEVAEICRRRGDRLIEIAGQLGATAGCAQASRPPAEPPSKSAKPSASKPPPDAPRPGVSAPQSAAVSAPRPTVAPTASSVIVPSPAPPLRLVIVPPGAPMPSPSPGIKYVRG